MQLDTLPFPWMRSQNDILHIEIFYISKENWDELSEDTISTAVSDEVFVMFVLL